LLVPNAALRYSPPAAASGRSSGSVLTRLFRAPRMGGNRQTGGDGANRGVWVLRNGTPERVALQTGPSDGQSTVVQEGELQEGDLVISDATA
ncbi:efflux RND transporter periplasmic adaptor subunit, partial [Tritonibacter sp. SIMBA_163]